MAKCCGKIRDANFCPECGKQLRQTANLAGLLKHIRMQEIRYSNETALKLQRGLKTQARNRWKAWGDELEKLMDGDKLKVVGS